MGFNLKEGIQIKICKDCGNELPTTVEYFYKNKSSSDGLHSWCKECTKKRASKWQKDNPERYKEIRKGTEEKPRTKLLKREMNQRLLKEGKRKDWQNNNKDKISEYVRNKRENKTHNISNEEWENCKNYFHYRCAYCGLAIEEHYIRFKGQIRLGDFHREHVDDKGANDLSNCIPACKSCNSKKNILTLDEWYSNENELCGCYSFERLLKIFKWLKEDYKQYIKNYQET